MKVGRLTSPIIASKLFFVVIEPLALALTERIVENKKTGLGKPG